MAASEYRGRRSGENACLFNYLYWKFLLEHEGTLRANPHMGAKVLALRYVDVDERIWIQIQARRHLGELDHWGQASEANNFMPVKFFINKRVCP